MSDDRGRTVVTDYFKDLETRIYPVGRLDYDTSGLLLLTNDGEFTNLMTHPRYHIQKKYVAKLRAGAGHGRLNQFPDLSVCAN